MNNWKKLFLQWKIKKSELETLLSSADTDFSKIEQINKEYKEVCEQLEAKYPRWEELAELLPY